MTGVVVAKGAVAGLVEDWDYGIVHMVVCHEGVNENYDWCIFWAFEKGVVVDIVDGDEEFTFVWPGFGVSSHDD